jgi:hypothetical protein
MPDVTSYAYVHARPGTVEQHGIFYVGKGRKGRYKALPARNRFHGFVLDKHGAENILVGKIECSDADTAFELEKGLIKCLKRAGVTLTNMTDGGDGPNGFVMPQHAREKIAASSRERAKDPVLRERLRVTSTAAVTEYWADPENRAARIASLTGVKKTRTEASDAARRANALKGATPEATAKKAAASKERWADPVFREKMSEARRLAWQDPAKREAMMSNRSEGIKKSWADPEVKAKRITGIKASITLKRKD